MFSTHYCFKVKWYLFFPSWKWNIRSLYIPGPHTPKKKKRKEKKEKKQKKVINLDHTEVKINTIG